MTTTNKTSADHPPAWFTRAIANAGEPGRTTVDGVSIAYRAWGDVGRPGIALVHGSNAHLEWWRFVAPFLADQFRVVALDLSGNGDSGWRERYTGAQLAEEVWRGVHAGATLARPAVVR